MPTNPTNQTVTLASKPASPMQTGDQPLALRSNGSVVPIDQSSFRSRSSELTQHITTLAPSSLTAGHWYRIARMNHDSGHGTSAIVQIGTVSYQSVSTSVVTLAVSKGYLGSASNPNSNRARIDVISALLPTASTEPKTDIAFPKARLTQTSDRELFLDVQIVEDRPTNGLCATGFGLVTILDTFDDVTATSDTILIEQELANARQADRIAPTKRSYKTIGEIKAGLVQNAITEDLTNLYFPAPNDIFTHWGDDSYSTNTGSRWTFVKMSAYTTGEHFTYLATTAIDDVYVVRRSDSDTAPWRIFKLNTTLAYSGL